MSVYIYECIYIYINIYVYVCGNNAYDHTPAFLSASFSKAFYNNSYLC